MGWKTEDLSLVSERERQIIDLPIVMSGYALVKKHCYMAKHQETVEVVHPSKADLDAHLV